MVASTHHQDTTTQTTLKTQVTTSTSVVTVGTKTSESISQTSSETKLSSSSTTSTSSSPLTTSSSLINTPSGTSSQISSLTSSISSVDGIEGTGSQTTPSESPSSNDFDAALHATQRMSVILGATLGSVFWLLFICTGVLLLVLYRRRQKVKKEEGQYT